MTALKLALGFIVVLLDDLFIGGELYDAGEILKVDRAVRNDLVGSKTARDATDDEVAAYRAAEAEAAAEDAAAPDEADAAEDDGAEDAKADASSEGTGKKKAGAK